MRKLRKKEAKYLQAASSLHHEGKSQETVACLCAQS